MYGLVNKGLEDLIRRTHGDVPWQRICAAAGASDVSFATMQAYPDGLTYALVGAASAELGISVASLLEQFGEHWVLYTGREGYGPLFTLAGNSVHEVLKNLDALHARMEHTFPQFRSPEFSCERLETGELRLSYRSSRDGLAPMVIGLVRGLGRHFGTPVEVRHTRAKGAGCDHDEFLLQVAA
jgi:hypothetical protein